MRVSLAGETCDIKEDSMYERLVSIRVVGSARPSWISRGTTSARVVPLLIMRKRMLKGKAAPPQSVLRDGERDYFKSVTLL